MTPGELSEQLLQESSEFSRLSDELAVILEQKPAIWMELRRDTKSDTSAERAWQATPNGVKETTLKLKLKALEKNMSAIRTRLRIMSDEAKNLF